jgi:hypothetical protein
MEFINKSLTIKPKTELSQEPFAVALRERYGTSEELIKKWSPRVQSYCSNNIEEGALSSPTMVRLSKAYGRKVITTIITLNLTKSLLDMGELNVDDDDVRTMAENIVADENLRQLHFSSIIAFFHKLACGQFELRFVNNYYIMQAMQDWAREARTREHKAQALWDERQKQAKEAEHAKNSMSFAEYAKLNGIDDKNPIDELNNAI